MRILVSASLVLGLGSYLHLLYGTTASLPLLKDRRTENGAGQSSEKKMLGGHGGSQIFLAMETDSRARCPGMVRMGMPTGVAVLSWDTR